MEAVELPERLRQKLREIAANTDMLQRQGSALLETFLEARGIPLDTKFQLAPDFSVLIPTDKMPEAKK